MEVSVIFLLMFLGAYIMLGTYLLANAIGLTQRFRAAPERDGASEADSARRIPPSLRSIVLKDDE